MLRLAIFGLDKKSGNELSGRLRGASAEIVTEISHEYTNLTSCDAAVFLGSFPFSHDFVDSFLLAGKHVLLAIDPFWTSNHLQAFVKNGEPKHAQCLAVNPDRYLPSRQLTKQQLDSGKLGDVGLLRIHRWHPCDETQMALGFVPSTLLADLDLTLWLINRTPTQVYATGNLPVPSGDGDTSPTEPGHYVQIHLGFSGGGMALIDNSARLPAGDGFQSLSVIGSTGAAYADDHQNTQLIFGGGPPQGILASERMKQLVNLTQEFVDRLQAGHSFTGENVAWQNVERLAAAVIQSLNTRQAVSLETA